jgi:hypothetical protein
MVARFQIAVGQKALLDYNKKKLKAAFRKAGGEVAAATKALMRSSGGGRTYGGSGGGARYRGYKKGKYTASAPGQAPVPVTKTLIRSIKVLPFKSGEGVAVREGIFYAKFLETGARGGIPGKSGRGSGKRNTYDRVTRKRTILVGTRILEPRPALTVALDRKKASIGTRMLAAVKDGITFKRVK